MSNKMIYNRIIDTTQEKFKVIKKIFGEDNYVGDFSTNKIKFCRVIGNLQKLEELENSMLEISSIDPSPNYIGHTSSIVLQDNFNKTVLSPPEQATDVVLFEKGTVKHEHQTIENTVNPAHQETFVDDYYGHHATAVGSLIVLGESITPEGNIQQENKIIPIILDGVGVQENIIRDTIKEKNAIFESVRIDLNSSIKKIDGEISKIIERIQKSTNETLIESYENKIISLEDEKSKIKLKLEKEEGGDEIDIGRYFGCGFYVFWSTITKFRTFFLQVPHYSCKQLEFLEFEKFGEYLGKEYAR